jgi:hypothetical protein
VILRWELLTLLAVVLIIGVVIGVLCTLSVQSFVNPDPGRHRDE